MWETLRPGNLEFAFSSVILWWCRTEETAARDLCFPRRGGGVAKWKKLNSEERLQLVKHFELNYMFVLPVC